MSTIYSTKSIDTFNKIEKENVTMKRSKIEDKIFGGASGGRPAVKQQEAPANISPFKSPSSTVIEFSIQNLPKNMANDLELKKTF